MFCIFFGKANFSHFTNHERIFFTSFYRRTMSGHEFFQLSRWCLCFRSKCPFGCQLADFGRWRTMAMTISQILSWQRPQGGISRSSEKSSSLSLWKKLFKPFSKIQSTKVFFSFIFLIFDPKFLWTWGSLNLPRKLETKVQIPFITTFTQKLPQKVV